MGKVSFPTGRFIGLKLWMGYTVNSLRYSPSQYFRAILWRDFYNWLLPLKLRARIWNWCFPTANFMDWESLPWWTWAVKPASKSSSEG